MCKIEKQECPYCCGTGYIFHTFFGTANPPIECCICNGKGYRKIIITELKKITELKD